MSVMTSQTPPLHITLRPHERHGVSNTGNSTGSTVHSDQHQRLTLLCLCEGNPLVTGGYPIKKDQKYGKTSTRCETFPLSNVGTLIMFLRIYHIVETRTMESVFAF